MTPAPFPGGRLTVDAMEPWGLSLCQPARGLRFGLDAVLLASRVEIGDGETAVELGTGCGVVSLVLARRHPRARAIVAVEIHPLLARVAQENVRRNGATRVHVMRADYTSLALSRPADVVFGNPPYRPTLGSTPPADPLRAIATREERATLRSTVAAAARLLSPRGRLHLIYPARRRGELLAALRDAGLAARRVLSAVPVEGRPPGLVVVTASPGNGGAPVDEELAVLHPDGTYTDAGARAYGFADAASMTRGGRRPGMRGGGRPPGVEPAGAAC